MAFCNSCGATLSSDARFCNKCGAAVIPSSSVASSSGSISSPPVTAGPAPATIPTPSRSGDNNAFKIVLALIGAVILLGIVGLAAMAFIGLRIAHRTHVRDDGKNVKVETPFGTVESTKDPTEAARQIGVDVYPGARVLDNGAQVASFGDVHTASATFETPDSADKVSTFYKSKFPNAIVSSSQGDHTTIVTNDPKNIVTVNIQGEGDKTKIQISTVTHKSGS